MISVPVGLPSFETTPPLDDATFGQITNYVFGIQGGTPPYTCNITGAPPGMALRTASTNDQFFAPDQCALMGAPTQTGSYTVTATFTDSASPRVAFARTFQLNVVALGRDRLVGGSLGAPYGATLRILGGSGPYSWTMGDGYFAQGLTLSSTTGVLSGTPLENGGFNARVTYSANGLSLTQNTGDLYVNNGQAQEVSLQNPRRLPDASLNQQYNFQFGAACAFTQVAGALPAGIQLNSAGYLYGTPTVAGDSSFALRCTDSSGYYGVRYFQLRTTPLIVGCATNLSFANVGAGYSAPLCVNNATGTLTWSVAPGGALPEGVTLNSITGAVQGTPVSPGQYYFQVQASDGASNQITFGVNLPVYPAGGAPPMAIGTPPDMGTFGIGPLNYGLSVSGGAPGYSWSYVTGTLPPGIALRSDLPPGWNPGSGASLIGVATTPGTYNFTLRATDSVGQSLTQAFTVRVVALRQLTYWQLPDGFVGVAYNLALASAGQTGTVTWAVAPGNVLPSGMTLSPGGVLGGSPLTAGGYSIGVNVTDLGTGTTVYANYNISIYAVRITSPGVITGAVQNQPFSATVTAAGGAGGYTFSVGGLPNGLNLNPITGVISGTVNTGPTNWRFPVTVRDNSGAQYTRQTVINIVGAPPVLPSLDPLVDPVPATLGISYRWTFHANGGTAPYTWNIASAPAGFVLRTGGGTPGAGSSPCDVDLAGVPATLGPQTFTISFTDSSPTPITVSRAYTLNVTPLWWGPAPNSGVRGQVYSSKMFLFGGTAPYTFAMGGSALPAGLTLNAATGEITGTPIENGGFSVSVAGTDSTTGTHNVSRLDFSLYIASGAPSGDPQINSSSPLWNAVVNQPYWAQLNFCCANGPASFALDAGSSPLPAGLTLSSTGQLNGTPTAPGIYTFLVRMTDTATGYYGIRQLQLTVSPIWITSSWNLPFGNSGSSYNATFAATGGTGFTWAVAPGSALPPGLSLNSATGELTGTISSPGSYNFQLVVTDSLNNKFTFNPSLPVYPAGQAPPMSIDMGSDLGASSVGPIQYGLSASSGVPPYTWSVTSGSLPAGVALRTDLPEGFTPSGQAALMGVLTTPGASTFTLRVQDSRGSFATQTFTLRTTSLTPLDQGTIPEGFIGQAYAYRVRAAGNTGTATWSLSSGSLLPPGLQLSTTGDITGAPTTAGNYWFSLMVTDSTGSQQRGYSMNVYAVRFAGSPLLPNATQYATYSASLVAGGGASPYTFSLLNSLPNGLSLNPTTGAITGTVNQWPGTWRFNAMVTDSAGRSYSRNFAICIIGAPPILPAINPVADLSDVTLGSNWSVSFSVDGGKAPYTWSVATPPPGFTLLSGSSLPSNIPPTDSWLAGVALASGDFTFTLSATDSSTPPVTVSRVYTLHVAPLWWFNASGAVRGQAYNASLPVYGGTGSYTWAVTRSFLPSGLTLDGATGRFGGAPLENGSANFQVTVTDTGGHYLRYWPNPWIASGTTPDINIGDWPSLGTSCVNCGYNHQFGYWGVGSATFSVEPGSTLPPGLSLSPSGSLTGTTSAVGQYVFGIRAAENGNPTNYGVRVFRLEVTPITITSNFTLPWTSAGSSYSATLTATGGTGPYTWTVAPGSALPPGLTLSNGVLTGVMQSGGAYNFEIVVTDSANPSHSFTFSPNLSSYAAGQGPPVAINMGPDFGTASIGPIFWSLNSSGGSGAHTWSLVSGTLPTGTALRSCLPWFASGCTGGLTGVLTTPGTYNFTLRVADAIGGAMTQAFTVRVTGLVITDPSPRDAFVGDGYSYQFTAAGNSGPVTWSLQQSTTLPAPLTLDPVTGTISGTPATPGNYSFCLGASDGTALYTKWYTLFVSAVRFTTDGMLPNATQGVPYSTTITAAGGTGPYTFDLSGWRDNMPGVSLSPSGVLSGSSPTGGNYTWRFTVRVTDSQGKQYSKLFSLTVLGIPLLPPQMDNIASSYDVTLGANVTLAFSARGGMAPYSWSITGVPAGMMFRYGASGSSNLKPSDAELVGVPTMPGTYTFTVTLTDSEPTPISLSRTFTLRVLPITPEGGIANGTRNAPYSYALRAHGGRGPYTWALVSGDFPNGLAMAPSGLISGTPTEDGSFNVTLTVTDADGIAFTQGWGFNIAPPTTPAITINNSIDLPDAQSGSPYSTQLGASGVGSVTFSLDAGSTVSSAPLTLSASGLLSGTPATPGRYLAIVRATDNSNGGNYSLRRFRLQVTPLRFTSPSTMPWGNVGAQQNVTLTASGGTGSYAWSLAPGNYLPAGLSLSADGVLSGSPASAGLFNFNLTVTDSVTGLSRTQNFSFSSYPAGGGPALSPAQAPNLGTFSIGKTQFQLAATGGRPPYIWSVEPGSQLPPGLALRNDNPTWIQNGNPWGLEGVVTAPGLYSFTMRLTDSAGASVTQTYSMPVTKLSIAEGQSSLPEAFPGTPYHYTLTAVGGSQAVSWSLSSCCGPTPSWLSLNPVTGEISGTPDVTGTSTIWVNVTDGGVMATRPLTISVPALRITNNKMLPNAVSGTPYSQQLTATGGTLPYSFSIWSGSLPSGLSLSSSGLISGTTTSGNSGWNLSVRVADSGGLTYNAQLALGVVSAPRGLPSLGPIAPLNDVSLGTNPNYGFSVWGGTPPYTWAVTGNVPPGMILRWGWGISPNNYANKAELTGPAIEAGTYNFTISATDSSPSPVTASYPYTLTVSPLAFDSPPSGIRGVAYTGAVRVLGGTPPYDIAYLWGTLPAGIVFDPVARAFVGTATENTSRSAYLRATDADGNTLTQSVGVTISTPSGSSATIGNWNFGDATVNAPLNYSLSSGWTYALVPGSPLPPGLSLVGNAVIGTPTTSGAYSFLISLTNGSASGVTQCVLNVTPVIVTTNFNLPWANVNSPYSTALAAQNGTGPYTWSMQPGYYLPPGLTLLSGGVITGSPTSAGQFTIYVTAKDANNFSRNFSFNLSVYPPGQTPPLSLSPGSSLGMSMPGRQAYSLTASGGFPPYTYSFAPGTEVPGMRLQSGAPLPTYFSGSANGGLLGVVFTPGVYSTTIRVTDSHFQTFDAPTQFTVLPVMVISQTWLPRATAGVPYSFQFEASGPGSSYTWAPILSSWGNSACSISAAGLFTCDATLKAGSYSFRATATDNLSNMVSTDTHTLIVNGFALNTPGGGPVGVLPTGAQNTDYGSQTITVTGGTGPYKWCISNGSLPAGLTSGQNDCSGTNKFNSFTISGSPTSVGVNNTFTLTVKDSGSPQLTAVQVFSLPVRSSSATPPPISVGTTSINDVSAGTFAWSLLTNNGWPDSSGAPLFRYEVTAGSLPPGLKLGNAASITQDGYPGWMAIYGRPTAAGTYPFTLKVTDGNGNWNTQALSIKVSPLLFEYNSVPPISGQTIPYNTPYSQKLLVFGGSGSYTFTGSAPGGMTLSSQGVVSGSALDTGNFWLPVTVNDGPNSLSRTINYNIASPTASTLTITNSSIFPTQTMAGGIFNPSINVSGGIGPYTITLAPGSTLPPGLALVGNQIVGMPMQAGTYTFSLWITDSAATPNFGARTFTFTATPVYVQNTLPDATTRRPFIWNLQAFGGRAPYSWSVNSGSTLPAWLTLSGSTLSGTPPAAGDYGFYLTATDQDGYTGSNYFAVHASALYISDDPLLPNAMLGAPYGGAGGRQLTLEGGTGATWSVLFGSLPAAMSLSSSGVLSGASEGYGQFVLTVQAALGSDTFKKQFTIYSATPYPDIASPAESPAMPDAVVGQMYGYNLTPSDGVPADANATPKAGAAAPGTAFTWSLAPGSSLPPGLALYQGASAPPPSFPVGEAAIAGAPATAGTYSFTLQVTDGAGVVSQKVLTLRVANVAIVNQSLSSAQMGPDSASTPVYSQTLTAVGGSGGYSFSLVRGTFPPGLVLSSGGTISGKPSGTGNYNFTVQVASGGSVYWKAFSILVNSTSPAPMRITTNDAVPFLWGIYRQLNLNAAGGSKPYSWSLAPGSGPVPDGMQVYSDGRVITSSIASGQGVLYGIPTRAGTFVYTLQVTDKNGNFARRTFTTYVTKLQRLPIPNNFILNPRVGQAFSYALPITGGTLPYTFALGTDGYLPRGLTLSAAGVVSGTASAPESVYNVPFVVSDAAGYTLTSSFHVEVLPVGMPTPLFVNYPVGGVPPQYPDFSLNQNLPFELDGVAYQGMDKPFHWTASTPATAYSTDIKGLPPGMSVTPGGSGSSDLLAGAPSAPGMYDVALSVSTAAGQTLQTVIRVNVSALAMTPATIPGATVGQPYSQTLTPSGGTAPYTMRLPWNSCLPVGLAFNPATGVLSGTPISAGRYIVVVVSEDSAAVKNTLTRSYTLMVDSPATPTPLLRVTPASSTVTYVKGGMAPPPVPINIGTTSGTPTFGVTLTGPPGASLTSSSGTAPASTSVILNPAVLSLLDPGLYTWVVLAGSNGAANSPQAVSVTANVISAAACGLSLGSASGTLPAGGGSGSVALTTLSGCSWQVTAPSWVTVTSSNSGYGPAQITFSAPSNPGTTPRSGDIAVTIGGTSATYSLQQFGSSCSYSASVSSLTPPGAGGSAIIGLTASLASGCGWTASAPDWITFDTGYGSGTGNGEARVTVTPNTSGDKRTGTITVSTTDTIPATLTISVEQAMASCSYTLSAFSAAMSAGGGTGSVIVTPSPTGCRYDSSGPAWISVLSGGTGTAAGTLNFSVSPNSTTLPRAGALAIGGQSFQVTQDGLACSVSLSNNNGVFSVGAPGTNAIGTIGVTVNGSNCEWSATSNATWLTVTDGARGTGTRDITFQVDSNAASTAPRSAAITVAGQSAVINQAGLNCTYTLRSPNSSLTAAASQGSIGVLTSAGCQWQVEIPPDAPWITMVSNTMGGSGTLLFDATANTDASPAGRSAILHIKKDATLIAEFTVTQAPATCAYTLGSPSADVPYGIGVGGFTVATTATGCSPPTVLSYNGWLTAANAADWNPDTGSGGGGSVSFTAAENPNASSRSGSIQAGDRTFTVNQAGSPCTVTLLAPGADFDRNGGSGTVQFTTTCAVSPSWYDSTAEITLQKDSVTETGGTYTLPYTVQKYDSFVRWIRTPQIFIHGQVFTVKQTSW